VSPVAHWRNALRDSDLDRTAKLVGFVLSTYMDGRMAAWPAKTTLAHGASLGREGQKGNTAVDTAIDRLEARGLLVVDRKRGRRGFHYTGVIPRWYEGFERMESLAATGDNGPVNPPRNGAKSLADSSEIPRPGEGESAESAESVSMRANARGGKNSTRLRAAEPQDLLYDR
jgi:hypothetical protein